MVDLTIKSLAAPTQYSGFVVSEKGLAYNGGNYYIYAHSKAGTNPNIAYWVHDEFLNLVTKSAFAPFSTVAVTGAVLSVASDAMRYIATAGTSRPIGYHTQGSYTSISDSHSKIGGDVLILNGYETKFISRYRDGVTFLDVITSAQTSYLYYFNGGGAIGDFRVIQTGPNTALVLAYTAGGKLSKTVTINSNGTISTADYTGLSNLTASSEFTQAHYNALQRDPVDGAYYYMTNADTFIGPLGTVTLPTLVGTNNKFALALTPNLVIILRLYNSLRDIEYRVYDKKTNALLKSGTATLAANYTKLIAPGTNCPNNGAVFLATADGIGEVIKVNGNTTPTLALTSPADNQVLAEGNSYQVSGSATDADSNNVVTIKYKVNNGTTYNAGSGVSDGVTPISFTKNLTFSNKRIRDGSTDITGVDLAENTNHTLTVWAEDDQGEVSNQVTRTFTVVWNRPPTISGTDTNLGTISTIPTFNYSVTDPEGNSFTITEFLNGVQTKTFAGVAAQNYSITFDQDTWLRLALGVQHQVKVRATDSNGQFSERFFTFTRTETKIEFTLKNPFLCDAQPSRVLVTLDAVIPTGATKKIEVCNNAFDTTPTWEDVTSAVSAGRGYVFTNATKTATNWGINIRFNFDKGTATQPVLVNGFGGAFD